MRKANANACEHSLLKCGECRALEPKQVGPTHAELAREVDDLRAKLAALHGGGNGNGAALVLQAPAPITVAAPAAPLRLDLGCGIRKQPGFHGVDTHAFPGVDTVHDLGKAAWPWPDNSVDEAYCSHMLEHVPGKDIDFRANVDWDARKLELVKVVTWPRAHFFNELHRVLKPGGKAMFVTPYWCSCRAYGDITHEWPPVCEMFWYYLGKEWRKGNAPHDDMYTCDFSAGYGFVAGQHLVGRTDEYRNDAFRDHKEAAQDMQATIVARK